MLTTLMTPETTELLSDEIKASEPVARFCLDMAECACEHDLRLRPTDPRNTMATHREHPSYPTVLAVQVAVACAEWGTTTDGDTSADRLDAIAKSHPQGKELRAVAKAQRETMAADAAADVAEVLADNKARAGKLAAAREFERMVAADADAS